jgi:hypothetical protein
MLHALEFSKPRIDCSVTLFDSGYSATLNHSEKYMTKRREFVIQLALGAGCLMSGRAAFAETPMLADTDPTALSLGYKADGAKTDKVKYPKYATGQACASCALFQGKATDTAGACPIFAGKQVSAKGWCSAYAKKA